MAAFHIAFEVLRLDTLRNATVSTNTPVLSISRRFGFEQIDYRCGERTIGGKPTDMVHFILTRERWAEVRQQIVPKARLAETLVREWEKAQLSAPGEFTKSTRLACI
jgi:hypothetical protein